MQITRTELTTQNKNLEEKNKQLEAGTRASPYQQYRGIL